MTSSILCANKVTILTCRTAGGIATKKISYDKDGNLVKGQYSAGFDFEVREEEAHDIRTLGEIIKRQESRRNELIIRGQKIENAPKIVRRKKEGNEDGAFCDVGRLWVMLDIDDFPIPGWLDPVADPQAVVKWVRAALPRPFRKATCYYQFSTSQNLPKKSGDPAPKIAKLHLFFWLDRPVTSEQWRDYFNA